MKRQNWPRKKQELTEQEKYEKDFKQFSLLTTKVAYKKVLLLHKKLYL